MPKRIRKILTVGNISYVPLPHGLEAIIDVADISIVLDWNWHVRKDKNTLYAARNKLTDVNGKRGSTLMHRAIMKARVGLEVDHINGNGLDNRRINLRTCTKSQNQCNRKVSALSITGLKGVSLYKRDATWHARISHNGKRLCLGYYKTPEEAHAAYCEASARLHGEFGRIA